jgi:predicted GIY-YIG superfamily endonuclease
MGARSYYVYVLASRIGGTLYIGVINDLIGRAAEHKSKTAEGFIQRSRVGELSVSTERSLEYWVARSSRAMTTVYDAR